MSKSKEIIKEILLDGSPEEKRHLFGFTLADSNEKIYKKFQWYARSNFPRYFTSKDAPYHKDMVFDYLEAYRGNFNVLEAAHRDAAKTALLKLFVTFILQNDTGHFRKYIKILSKDLKNSKQIVTDIYNLMIETEPIYGDQFEKAGDKKREETMGSFTTQAQIKVASGTIGQDQRGHIQDAYRPDFLVFEDVEDSTSITSQIKTQMSILRAQEAIDGMAKGARFVVNCNYISEDGVIQWFMDKPSVRTRLIPIAEAVEYGFDPMGKKTLIKATPIWQRFTFEDLVEKYKDTLDWFGEYMSDPSRSDNKFFDIELINYHIENYAKAPIKVSAGVKYWSDYKPNHRYGQGSDHSEGIGADANTLCVFDFNDGALVATHANNMMSPDLATHEYARVGGEFGNCVWAPETNNRCGGIVITTAKDINYPNLYQYEIKDKLNNVLTNKVGWETNRKTRNTMLIDFRRDFNDGLIKIYDIDFLKEMKAFTNGDLTENTTGLITRHFDLLMAGCIGWAMRDHAVNASNVKDFYSNLGKSNTKARV